VRIAGTTCTTCITIKRVNSHTACLHQKMDAPRLGNPGLAYGFCATLEQGIDLDVRHKTPPLPSFFSLSSSHCSLLSSFLSATPRPRSAAAPPAHSTQPSFMKRFLKPSCPLGTALLRCPILLYAESRQSTHFWISTRIANTMQRLRRYKQDPSPILSV
jgi:hypothetical protein